MTYLIFVPLVLVFVVVLYFTFWRLFERYAPSNDKRIERECEELLKAANKPPRKRAF